MSANTVNQLVDRLTQPGPLTAEHFAALLGATWRLGETNPFWRTYSADLAGGQFARAELRLHTSNNAALLILEPRNPPGLTEADVNAAALGERLGMRPNPRIPPEGIVSEYFRKEGVRVTVQWTTTSRRLRSLVLEWEPPAAQGEPAGQAAASAN